MRLQSHFCWVGHRYLPQAQIQSPKQGTLLNGRRLRPTVSESAAASSTSGAIASGSVSHAEPVDDVANRIQDISSDNVAPSSRAGSGSIYCPVLGCPEGCPERVASWSTHHAMRPHLNELASGRCVGSIPSSYLSQHRLEQCQVCCKLLSIRFGGTCPRCRPQANRSSQTGNHQEGNPYTGSSLEEIFSKRVPTKAFVPKDHRRLWAQCLIQALAQVQEFIDVLAWAHFFMLPKGVLRSSKRGGKKHRSR